MAFTHERNKSARTKRGCILCYNIGAASPTFAYITLSYIPMFRPSQKVEKEVGLCFKHLKPKTEKNPNGIIDPAFGEWKKTPFGKMPVREGLYQLVDNNMKLVTGPAGQVPLWW